MSRKKTIVMVFMLLVAASVTASGKPLLGNSRDIDGVRLYSDSDSSQTFYYAPGKLSIPVDAEGTPDITFLQMRYMGTAATGHQGEFHTRSILSFKVKMNDVTGNMLASVRDKLLAEGIVDPKIKPLPIRRIETTLNYIPLADSGEQIKEEPSKAGTGSLEESDQAKPMEGYWTERVFTISPDDFTSQALWDSFHNNRVMLSLTYVFYADGILPIEQKPVTEGNVGSPDQPVSEEKDEEEEADAHIVQVDTVGVLVDASKYPDRFKKVDIVESIPPTYAGLSVYCFDFNNSLRPDLSAKMVEIQAASVTGKPVIVKARFSSSSPDVFSASLRFPFAVYIREPYRYRIHEITTEGEMHIKPWREGKSWSQILDVTTPPEEQPKQPEAEESEG